MRSGIHSIERSVEMHLDEDQMGAGRDDHGGNLVPIGVTNGGARSPMETSNDGRSGEQCLPRAHAIGIRHEHFALSLSGIGDFDSTDCWLVDLECCAGHRGAHAGIAVVEHGNDACPAGILELEILVGACGAGRFDMERRLRRSRVHAYLCRTLCMK